MRRNLQSKFNLLIVTLVVFSLLMVPMFNQVKADTKGSLKQAKNTWMSKMFREMSRDFKPRNLENTEVEDYWAEQVKQNNEDCRNDPNNAKCDANGDLDGDGVSNGDEVRQGRNPACNEDEMGDDYCRGKDQFNVTEPDPTPRRVERVFLGYANWTYAECSNNQPVAASLGCPQRPFVMPINTTLVECYMNITEAFTGNNWNFNIRGPANQNQCSLSGQFASGSQSRSSRVENPVPGQYNAVLTGSAVQSGRWEMMLWATVVS